MHVDSLAFRTDLALAALAGSEVEDRGDHVVVRTPATEEVPGWLDRFAATFPASRHLAFGVDGADGSVEDLAPLRRAGLSTEAMTVMTATEVHEPPRPNRAATYRPLVSDDDWSQQLELGLAGEDEHHSRGFVAAKTAAERSLTGRGTGEWWGAFVDVRLAASMGLIAVSPGLARFQQVKTHPDARGRGLAGTLVHEVSRFGFEELGATTLVMVADPGYLAIRIYRSVGFADTEAQLMAQRKPT